MIVVAIIGVLATMAVPAYDKFTCRAEQSEAKGHVNLAVKLAEAYFQDHSDFGEPEANYVALDGFGVAAPDGGPLGFRIVGRARYAYAIQSAAEPDKYVVDAVGMTGRVEGDVWHASAATGILHLTNACE